jgi:cyanate permease
VTRLAVGTAASPQLAVPLARLAGWRTSMAVWSLMSALVLVPWLVQLLRDPGRNAPQTTTPRPAPARRLRPPPGRRSAWTRGARR